MQNDKTVQNKKNKKQKEEEELTLKPEVYTTIFNPKNERELDLATKQLLYVKRTQKKKAYDLAKEVFENEYSNELKNEDLQYQLLIRMLNFYENMKKINLNEGLMVMFLKLLEYFEINEKNKEEVRKNWKKCHFVMLKNLLNHFKMLDQIDIKDVANQVTNLIFNSKFKEAVGLYKVFPQVKQHLDTEELVLRMVTQANLDEAEAFVFDDPELQKYFVRTLIEKLYNEKAVFYIQKFQLDYRLFPTLQERFKKAKLERLVKKQDLSQDKIEEIIAYSKEMLVLLADTLFTFKSPNHALSIIQRHKLEKEADLLEKCDNDLLSYLNSEKFEYVINPILEKDGFGPTDEICLGNESNAFIKLNSSQFNITENDVIFIDSIDTQFEQAKTDLQSSTFLGFDSEFEPTITSFQESGVATLQLATNKKIYIFDIVHLKSNQIFVTFIESLFTNPKILKIGHSITQDFSKMENNFKINTKIIEKEHGWIDIATEYKNHTKRKNIDSLQVIAQVLIGGKMDKTEQVSNWIARPLRKCQLHYAALDAYSCLIMYQNLKENIQKGKDLKEHHSGKQKKNKDKQGEKMISFGNFFTSSEKYQDFWAETGEVKFLVDNMLFKLVKYLRNVGIDTAYIKHTDKNLLVDLSLQEKRIVVTRDQKFFFSKKRTVPTYFFPDQGLKTEGQFKELMNFFKINDRQDFLLSRCVHCNSKNLQISDSQTVKKYLHFKNEEDYEKYEFWLCLDCKQVYWEGATFQKSKQRFKELTENLELKRSDFLITNIIDKTQQKLDFKSEPFKMTYNKNTEIINFKNSTHPTKFLQGELYNEQKQLILKEYLLTEQIGMLKLDLSSSQYQCNDIRKIDIIDFKYLVIIFNNTNLSLYDINFENQQIKLLNTIQMNNHDDLDNLQIQDNEIQNLVVQSPNFQNNKLFYIVQHQTLHKFKIHPAKKTDQIIEQLAEKKVCKCEHKITDFMPGENYIFISLLNKKIVILDVKNFEFIQEFNPLFDDNISMKQLIYLNPLNKLQNYHSTEVLLALSELGHIKIIEWSQRLIQYNSIQDIFMWDDETQLKIIEQQQQRQQNELQMKKQKSSKSQNQKENQNDIIKEDMNVNINYDLGQQQIQIVHKDNLYLLKENPKYFLEVKNQDKKKEKGGNLNENKFYDNITQIKMEKENLGEINFFNFNSYENLYKGQICFDNLRVLQISIIEAEKSEKQKIVEKIENIFDKTEKVIYDKIDKSFERQFVQRKLQLDQLIDKKINEILKAKQKQDEKISPQEKLQKMKSDIVQSIKEVYQQEFQNTINPIFQNQLLEFCSEQYQVFATGHDFLNNKINTIDSEDLIKAADNDTENKDSLKEQQEKGQENQNPQQINKDYQEYLNEQMIDQKIEKFGTQLKNISKNLDQETKQLKINFNLIKNPLVRNHQELISAEEKINQFLNKEQVISDQLTQVLSNQQEVYDQNKSLYTQQNVQYNRDLEQVQKQQLKKLQKQQKIIKQKEKEINNQLKKTSFSSFKEPPILPASIQPLSRTQSHSDTQQQTPQQQKFYQNTNTNTSTSANNQFAFNPNSMTQSSPNMQFMNPPYQPNNFQLQQQYNQNQNQQQNFNIQQNAFQGSQQQQQPQQLFKGQSSVSQKSGKNSISFHPNQKMKFQSESNTSDSKDEESEDHYDL